MAASAITESMSVCVSRWVDERSECIKALGVAGGLLNVCLFVVYFWMLSHFLRPAMHTNTKDLCFYEWISDQ